MKTPHLPQVSSALAGLAAAAGIASCFGFARGSTHEPCSLTRGLIHWWKFNGNCIDSVGDLDAFPVGPVSYFPAITGDGFVFNGSSTGIGLPPQPELQFRGSFSLSAWALLNKYPPEPQMWSSIIFDGDDRPGLDPYALQVGTKGNLEFLLTGEKNLATVDTVMPLHKFVLVTGTYDKNAGRMCLYTNGKLAGSHLGDTTLTPVVALVANQTAGVGIGTNNGFPNPFMNFSWEGVVSDLRIYNRALSSDEVEALYKQGVAASK